jgi:hypothetical protein
MKDQATTHPFRKRCVDAHHMGACPTCATLVSAKYGCSQHGLKGDELCYNLEFVADEATVQKSRKTKTGYQQISKAAKTAQKR